MRILIVNKFLHPNGGSETYIFKLGQELMNLGHEVQYFGMDHEERVVGNSSEVYTSSMDFHTGKIQKVLYPFKIIYSRESKYKIRKILDEFKPDVVHLNNFNFQLTPSVIYEIKRHKIPIVYTAHDSQLVCPNHLLMQYRTGKRCEQCLEKGFWQCAKNKCIHGSKLKSILGSLEACIYRKLKTYRMIDVVVCPSYFMQKKLEVNPDLEGRTVVLRNFVSLPGESTSGVNEKYVLYFGRYSEEKGVRTLLKVCENTPGISYRFAGNGPLLSEIEREENIVHLGFLQSKELTRVIRGAAFVIFPSECYENCPFTVMEAQLCGTPVIASGIGGTVELVEDGVTGAVFEPGNATELQTLIEKWWNDPEIVVRYSENCKKKKFMGIREYTEEMIKIYEESRN